MQFGLPSITTKMGAEAMHDDLPWNGYISENNEDFIEKAVAIYSDEKSWKIAQENGFTILEKGFKKALFETDFALKIEDLQQNLPTHRNHNFLGQVLQHQSLQSTKYMSKWIEAKNKI